MTLPTHALLDGDTLPATMVGSVFAETFTDEQGAEQGRYPAARLVALPDGWHTRPMLWTGSAFVDDVASERVRLTKKAQAVRDAVQASGCMTAKGRVQTDPDSRATINTFYVVALGAKAEGVAYSISFTMADNTRATHNADEMIAMGGAVATFFATVHAAFIVKRDALTAATTLAGLWAIVPFA